MLRFFLPPNLAAAAPRDAIAVKLEVDLAKAPSPELLPALALLQALCRSSTPPPFLQLTRAQLQQFVTTLQGQPVFFWINQPAQPIFWVGPLLRGVSEHLQLPKPPTEANGAPNTAPSAAAPTRQVAPAASRGREASAESSALIVDGSEHFLSITLPSRESFAYAAALDLVKSNGFVLEPSNRKWWLRDRHKVLNFLARFRARLEDEFHADFTANFEKNTSKLQFAEIACDAIENGDGFNVTLALRAGRVSEDQILSAAASNRGYVEDNGRVFLLDPDRLRQLGDAQRALAGDGGGGLATRRTHRVSAARLADAQDILEHIAPHFQPPAEWRARSEALRDLTKLASAPLPDSLAAQLRPYQRVGAAWLWHLYRNKLGGILADEMGLGKTLQALALLTAIHRDARIPSLVVCPASLVENWRREAARFAPQLRTFIHHGTSRIANVNTANAQNLIITSYGTLARDRETFENFDFACIIADEAQHLKNRRTQNAQSLRALQSRGRFLLTGTPLENSLDDLRSLFEVLMPGYLEKVPTGTRGDERAWFDERLRAKTAPYILRRTKQAVAPELPEKIEQVLYCELSSAQSALYRRVQEESERELIDLEAKGASENSIRFATLTQLLRLRQVCCDPRLLPNGATISATDSAKLETFRELLEEAVDDGHRLLVFSQFTSLLALLRAELEKQELAYCYLDGSMPVKARQAEVDRFNQAPDIPVFLISLKAGGTGLNLTAADTVVHFDPWWNPAVEAQATDRAHRIGQTRVVTSYKLICSGTVEEKVLQLQESKRALLAGVFEASDEASAKISLADLKALMAG
ncbi:MAG TPA: DEAD/DEAH box helicase [Opitutaceae bacterium]|nr:DEAD/DEAH box helicase [Opitutaceae bacterium]